ncbi:hypothetical protein [Streptomyces meridianus]|uniref:hypothetical protein n=1 Tax=Streptomyces meridianus TaxID=2938945 RepID=UPI00203A8B93|nr:hypothetical protein [Streptomyces meridianus]
MAPAPRVKQNLTVRWGTTTGPDSLRGLAVVAALFTVLQLAIVLPGSPLGWDETVYFSQVSADRPSAFFSAPRARGISYLVAPVAVFTTSTEILRVYLALLSGAALFASFAAWRRLLPPALLAGAAALFASLWITQYYGPQAMPNLWVAYAALAATGCFLRVVRPVPDRWGVPVPAGPGVYAGLAAAVAFAALMRPADAAWLVLPLAAALTVRRWRRPAVLALLVGGLLVGSLPWVVEAYLHYGGPAARLDRASEIQGGMGLHMAVDDQIRSLQGRSLCRPCDIPWSHPLTGIWWFVLPLLALGGATAAVHIRRTAVLLLPLLTGLALSIPYLFLIDYAAPRFLLPTYALLSLPVAYCCARIVAGVRPRWRPVTGGLLMTALALHVAAQYGVLQDVAARARAAGRGQERVTAALETAGLQPPCTVSGEHAVQVAWGLGCASRQVAGHDESITPAGLLAAAAQRPVAFLVAGSRPVPDYVRQWRTVRLPNVWGLRDYRAYVSPSAGGTAR